MSTMNTIMQQMEDLATALETAGNIEGAADVRADIQALSAPRPTVVQSCDSCRKPVTSKRQADKYDALGVDWLLCAGCEAR